MPRNRQPNAETKTQHTSSIEPITTDSNPSPLRALPSYFKFTYTWKLASFTGALLAITIVYAWAVSVISGPLSKLVPPSVSSSLLVLRITTEVTGILLGILCASTLEVILWGTAGSGKGITTASLLGISPTTGLKGLLLLLGWKTNPDGRGDHHLWVAKRYIPKV